MARPDEASDDHALLESMGYEQELPRVLRFWTNWAVGFAFISPIVGLYTVVALNATTAGPAWVWVIPIVTLGQFLVALSYTQLAAKWPVAGGIYQWSRRLIGPKYGWWAGWIYMWALIITLSLVAYAGGGFLAELCGVSNPSTTTTILFALIVMAVVTAVNAAGIQLLRFTINIGIACELIGSVGLGIVLLLAFRNQPISALTDTSLTPAGVAFFPAFLAALAAGGWILLGFDACGALAEETRDAVRQVPRAIVLSILMVGIVDLIAGCALMLSTPDLGAVVSGKVADPVSGAVTAALGGWAHKPFLAVVVVSFIACGIAVQGGTVRVVYSYSRDGMIPLSSVWRKVASHNHTPVYAVFMVAVLSSLAFVYANALSVLVGFATGGYYLGFLFPVAALLYQRLRGRWTPGKTWRFGIWGLPLSIVASVWLVGEFVNIAWPRATDLPWYQNWAVELGIGAFVIIGAVYFAISRPDRRFTATAAADMLDASKALGAEPGQPAMPPGAPIRTPAE